MCLIFVLIYHTFIELVIFVMQLGHSEHPIDSLSLSFRISDEIVRLSENRPVRVI